MRILVLQHHEAEHPGILRDFMAEDGIQWDAVQLQNGETVPPLDGYDALWVMGGPMDVWEEHKHPWLVPEKETIRSAVFDRRMPFLGCCLGHQLLAEVSGGQCEAMDTAEVGVLDVSLTDLGRADPLFSKADPQFKAVQWHGVGVTRVPETVEVLARSPACDIQAIRVGDRAWGLQYHVEVTETTVTEWGAIPEYANALEKTLGPDALPGLKEAADANMGDFRRNARSVYDNFMAAARVANV